MAGRSGGAVLKSASTGVLRPMGMRGLGGDKGHGAEDIDPLQAVLNHSWNKAPAHDDDHGGRKRIGIAGRNRGLAAEMGGLKGASSTDKKDEGRSRLGATGALFVDTGGKRGLGPTFDDQDSPHAADSPPTSPGDGTKAGRRDKKGQPAAPTRRYQNEVCPDRDPSPRLQPAPLNRKGQVKLDFENEAAEADKEHAQSEVDDHKPHLDKEQQHFIDLVHHFHGAVNQAGVRLNEMLQKVRKKFLEDPKYLDGNKFNYDQLTEIAFEVQTANYYINKWHHQLEPRKVSAPPHPSKIEDMSAEDILAQALYSISKMEVSASKFGPVVEKICHDARTLRRGPNGEPLTPRSKNALELAKKRGFQDIDDFNKFLGHMEHLLSVTQHLATPPQSGLPDIKSAAVAIMAAAKFKKGLTRKNLGGASASGGGLGGLAKSLGEAKPEASEAKPEASEG